MRHICRDKVHRRYKNTTHTFVIILYAELIFFTLLKRKEYEHSMLMGYIGKGWIVGVVWWKMFLCYLVWTYFGYQIPYTFIKTHAFISIFK